MRRLLALSLVLAAAVAAVPTGAAAQRRASTYSSDSSLRAVPRYPMRGADALVSRDGRTALLLVDRTLILQLTHEGVDHLAKAGREAERDAARDLDSAPIGRAVAALVGSVMRTIADHGLEYDLRDLREARHADGRLVLRRASGEEVFGDVEVQGTRVMESFDPREARAFADRVRAAAGLR